MRILRFTKLAQVEKNLKALELYKKWTPEIEKSIHDILNNDLKKEEGEQRSLMS